MRHQPPVLGGGWGPMTAPPRTPFRRHLIVPVVLLTIGLLTGLLRTRQGIVATVLMYSLYCLYRASRNKGETLLVAVGAGLLVAMLGQAGVAPPTINTTVDRKAPAERVEAAKGDLDKARQGAVNLWAQIASGFPGPTNKPQPKKGHH